MDAYLYSLYRSYVTNGASLPETLRSFKRSGVTFEDCAQAGLDTAFVRGLFPGCVLVPSRKKEETPKASFSVRVAELTDNEHLATLEKKFLLELNGREDKEDLSSVDALLLYRSGFSHPEGALWHEVLGNASDELYVRALYTDSSIRHLGGGRALLEHVLQVTAPEGGFRYVSLDAPRNVASFYRKVGFRGIALPHTDGKFTFKKRVEY